MPDFGDPIVAWFLNHYSRLNHLTAGVPDANVVLKYCEYVDLIVKFEMFIDTILEIRNSHFTFVNARAEDDGQIREVDSHTG